MLDTARKAMQFAKDKDREAYDNDEVLRVALAHLVQVIGEAARLTSPRFRDAHPEIPWPIIVGMRHNIVDPRIKTQKQDWLRYTESHDSKIYSQQLYTGKEIANRFRSLPGRANLCSARYDAQRSC